MRWSKSHHGCFTGVAGYQRLDHGTDLVDLLQGAFVANAGFDGDDERNRLVFGIDVNILLTAIVEEVKLRRLQVIHDVAVAIEDECRRNDTFDVDDDGLTRWRYFRHPGLRRWRITDRA